MKLEEMFFITVTFFIIFVFASQILTFKTAGYDEGFETGVRTAYQQIDSLQDKVDNLEYQKSQSFAGSIGNALTGFGIGFAVFGMAILVIKYDIFEIDKKRKENQGVEK